MEYKKKYKKLLLIDTSSIMHRCLGVPALFSLTNESNVTGGIYGSLNVILSELAINSGVYPIALFDGGLSPRRLELYPSYKNHDSREELPVLSPEEAKTDFLTQYRFTRSTLLELLPQFGIPAIRIRNWEADDLVYICSKLALESVILSDDKDYIQLVSPTVSVRRPKANELIDYSNFKEMTGYEDVNEFVKAKCMLGDGSDNITKACEGVGPSNVTDLLKLLKENNNVVPQDEKELKEICKDKDIKYRKAYMNFDKEIYKRNLRLIDLQFVEQEVNEQLVDSIISQIEYTNNVDIAHILSVLNALNIKHFDYNKMIGLVEASKINKDIFSKSTDLLSELKQKSYGSIYNK